MFDRRFCTARYSVGLRLLFREHTYSSLNSPNDAETFLIDVLHFFLDIFLRYMSRFLLPIDKFLSGCVAGSAMLSSSEGAVAQGAGIFTRRRHCGGINQVHSTRPPVSGPVLDAPLKESCCMSSCFSLCTVSGLDLSAFPHPPA